MDKRQQLIDLYAAMAAHTLPECRACFNPHSCCDAMYCENTIKFAAKKWGVDLPRTDHPKLPLMGPTGCTAAPHLRPMCTTHVCIVNSIGGKPNDAAWTKRYYELHEAIQLLEWELFPL
jgi:hypothetical protein